METCGSTSEPGTNLESGMETDDTPAENDFHFSYLTVDTSTEPPAQLDPPGESVAQNYGFEEGDIPIFYEIVPNLKEMASVVVAVALWRRVISLKSTNLNPDSCAICDEDQTEVEKLLECLPGPRLIREMIKIHLEPVKNQMKNWLFYYKHNLLTSKRATGEGSINIGDLLFCEWLPNGKIDDRQSALNMISNPRLSQVDKFKIMCRYCLEDEIKKLPANSFPSYFTKRIQFSKNALVYYWLCYVEGNLDLPKSKDQSIESFLVTAFNVDTWPAIEYFWDRLNVNEQLTKVEEILNRRPEFQLKLFSKMNEFQKRHLLSKIPIKIALNFWKLEAQEHCTLLTWIYIGNFLNYEQFKELIRLLLYECLSKDSHKIPWLVEIWNYVPDNLKTQSDVARMIIKLHTNYYVNPCRNIDFLLTTLSNFSIKNRKKLLFGHAYDLVLKLDPSMIDPLMKLCLPEAEDVLKFKNYLLVSNFVQDRCCSMFHDNDLRNLNIFLDFYCPDSNSRSEFCNKILNLFSVRGCPFYCLPKWLEMVEFIDDNLLDSLPHLALRHKKRLAWSFAGFCCELWTNDSREEMNKMIEVVTQVLDNEEVLVFKVGALEQVQTRYRWGHFDESVIGGFLRWCCDNDDQRARDFKKSLSIDGIFDYAFNTMKWTRVLENEIVDEETVFRLFDPMSRALVWYFEDFEDVKRYKLKKVFGHCDTGVSIFRKYTQMKNDVFTKNVLPWFFDGDREQIDKFREQFRDEEIGKMI